MAKCNADYEEAAAVCKGMGDDAQRKACQDRVYARYESCRKDCEHKTQKTCTDMYEDCVSRNYPPCNKKFEKEKTTMCKICQSGAPYKFKQCKQCGFSE